MLPACAATFVVGQRPPFTTRFGLLTRPTTSTDMPEYFSTLLPARRYLRPALSVNVYELPLAVSRTTQPFNVTGSFESAFFCGAGCACCASRRATTTGMMLIP